MVSAVPRIKFPAAPLVALASCIAAACTAPTALAQVRSPTTQAVGSGPELRPPQPAEAEEVPVQRDQAPGMPLEEFISLALSNSPNLREAASQAAAARGRAHQAGIYPNPQFGAASPQLAGSQSQYDAFMSIDVITKGKLGLDSDAQWRSARQAELMFVRVRFDVLTTVRQRFYTALAAQRRVEVLDGLAKIAGQSRDVGQRLLKGGQAARTDTLLLDIEFDRAEVARENALTVLEAGKRQLAAGVGLPELSIERLAGDLEAPTQDYDLIAVQLGVISRSALARSAEVEIARSRILLRRAEVEPFPNLNVMGGFQYQERGEGPNSQGMYQVTMSVPLWNRNQGNIRAAQASVGTAVAQMGRVRSELANSAADAAGRFIAARQTVDRYRQNILPKVRQSQRLVDELYRGGQFDSLNLLQSQRTNGEAQLEYINAQERRWTAAAEVAGLLQSETFP